MPRLEVTFLVDANGILSVTASDLRTGRERSVEVKPSYGLTDEEIERMLEESFDHAEDDVLQRQVREARVGADMILHATREQLAREATVLQPDEGERILAALRSLETLRDGQDYLAIRDAIEALSQASEPFARRIMDRSLNEALAQRRLGAARGKASGRRSARRALHGPASLDLRAAGLQGRSQGVDRGQAGTHPDGLGRAAGGVRDHHGDHASEP